jgi:hypothetical protein
MPIPSNVLYKSLLKSAFLMTGLAALIACSETDSKSPVDPGPTIGNHSAQDIIGTWTTTEGTQVNAQFSEDGSLFISGTIVNPMSPTDTLTGNITGTWEFINPDSVKTIATSCESVPPGNTLIEIGICQQVIDGGSGEPLPQTLPVAIDESGIWRTRWLSFDLVLTPVP